MSILIAICVFFPLLAAIVAYPLNKKSDKLCNLVVILSTFIVLVSAGVMAFGGGSNTTPLLSMNFQQSGFQSVYAVVTAFMWFCAALLSPQYFKGHHNMGRYYFFFLVTLGATMGVFLSADLITTFIFFEIMSFASYMWVVHEQDKEAMAAGKTYLTIAVLGGMVLLMGLFLLYSITGTLVISELYDAVVVAGSSAKLYAAAFCMLFGFGAKAGLFPLHIWLPKAHPVAPAPASALLSGVLTKSGIFGMLIITANIMRDDEVWGYALLILGAITMVLGAVIAVFSTNLKRTLACSSLSQIGFITVGVSMICLLGEENALAANGTVLYMLNHSIVKLALFLCAGAIYAGAHTLDINKLKGYGRNKPEILVPFLFGACSLAGIPGFAGYLSKTLVHEAIVEYANHGGAFITAIEWLFLFSGGLTAAYMLKLFITIFVQKPTEDTPVAHGKTSVLSAVSLALSSVMLLVVGVLPHALAEKISGIMLPFVNGHESHHEVEYFSFTNLKGVLVSLGIGIFVYAVVICKGLMKTEDGKKVHYNPLADKISLENNVYLPVSKALISVTGEICSFFDKLPEIIINAGMVVLTVILRACSDITDIILFVLNKTVLKTAKEPSEPHDRKYAYAIGSIYGRLTKKGKEVQAERFVRASETVSTTTTRLSKSFSFSLFMTCLGISIILLFLILK